MRITKKVGDARGSKILSKVGTDKTSEILKLFDSIYEVDKWGNQVDLQGTIKETAYFGNASFNSPDYYISSLMTTVDSNDKKYYDVVLTFEQGGNDEDE